MIGKNNINIENQELRFDPNSDRTFVKQMNE